MQIWKTFFLATIVTLTASTLVKADRHVPSLPVAKVVDGMYQQDWLYESSLDLRKDLAATTKSGKRLVIFWEQKGCAYCQPMYEVNLRIPRIVNKIKTNFNVIKLDIQGNRQITDLDGETLSEGDLAIKSRVMYTPTIQFLTESMEKAAGKGIGDTEVFRAETYFKPFHFNFLFHYVMTKGYETQPNFQRWLGNIGRDMEAKGIHYDLWGEELPAHLPDEY